MENPTNRETSPSPSSSAASSEPKYRGVRKRKWGKWVSEIRLRNSRERIWLGSYDTPEKAARAFDAALYCLHGNGANFNFPERPPEIPGGQSLSPQQIQSVASRYANEQEIIATTGSSSGSHNSSAAMDLQSQMRVQEEQDTSTTTDHDHDDMNMDWSFLSWLDSDYQGRSSPFGLSGFDGDFYPPPPTTTTMDDDNNGDDQPFSSLWNF